MTTWTLAYLRGTGMLVTVVEDGEDIYAAIRELEENAGVTFEDIVVEHGLVLTDDDAGRDVRYRSGLGDLPGGYEYAVRAA